MARPKIPLESQQIKQVETMAALGMKVEQIAAVLSMSKRTLERRIKETPGGSDALLKGRANASAKVLQTAFQMATSGKQPVMTIFWLKCREGWKETTVHELTGKDGKPIETKGAAMRSLIADPEAYAAMEMLEKKLSAAKGSSGDAK